MSADVVLSFIEDANANVILALRLLKAPLLWMIGMLILYIFGFSKNHPDSTMCPGG